MRAGCERSILLEMRPDGQHTIRIFRPHESAPTLLPFDEWGKNLLDTEFSYEDFLQPQYFWPGQTIVKSAVFGARHCNVLKSTPGPSDRTDYSEVQTWLDRNINYPVYAEKVMKQGGIVKEFTYYGLRQSSGVWSATQVEAKIRGRAGSTFLIIQRGSTKANLSISDFRPDQVSHFRGSSMSLSLVFSVASCSNARCGLSLSSARLPSRQAAIHQPGPVGRNWARSEALRGRKRIGRSCRCSSRPESRPPI